MRRSGIYLTGSAIAEKERVSCRYGYNTVAPRFSAFSNVMRTRLTRRRNLLVWNPCYARPRIHSTPLDLAAFTIAAFTIAGRLNERRLFQYGPPIR